MTVTIAVLTVAWLVDYVDRAVLPLALPAISHELRIGMADAGLVLAVYYFLYGVCQIAGGMVADRWGARPTMVLALVACSVTTALNGLVHGYAASLAVRALFAVSIAAIPGVTMKMLVERVRNFFQPQAQPDGPGVFVHLRRTGHDNLSPLGPT